MVSRKGRILSFDAKSLARLRSGGRQAAVLEESDTIATACVCPAESPLVIVSALGLGHCIKHDNLPIKKDLGAKMVAGMQLADGDSVVGCLPITEKDILMLSQDGYVMRLRGGAETLTAHGRTGKGVKLMKLHTGANVCAVCTLTTQHVLISSRAGRSICFVAEQIKSYSNAAMGVSGMKLRPGDKCMHIMCLQPEHEELVHPVWQE